MKCYLYGVMAPKIAKDVTTQNSVRAGYEANEFVKWNYNGAIYIMHSAIYKDMSMHCGTENPHKIVENISPIE